jgi:hypothetical protein
MQKPKPGTKSRKPSPTYLDQHAKGVFAIAAPPLVPGCRPDSGAAVAGNANGDRDIYMWYMSTLGRFAFWSMQASPSLRLRPTNAARLSDVSGEKGLDIGASAKKKIVTLLWRTLLYGEGKGWSAQKRKRYVENNDIA